MPTDDLIDAGVLTESVENQEAGARTNGELLRNVAVGLERQYTDARTSVVRSAQFGFDAHVNIRFPDGEVRQMPVQQISVEEVGHDRTRQADDPAEFYRRNQAVQVISKDFTLRMEAALVSDAAVPAETPPSRDGVSYRLVDGNVPDVVVMRSGGGRESGVIPPGRVKFISRLLFDAAELLPAASKFEPGKIIAINGQQYLRATGESTGRVSPKPAVVGRFLK